MFEARFWHHLTHIMSPVSFSIPWKHKKTKCFLMFPAGKKQTSGIKWVKMLNNLDIHWSFKLKVPVTLLKFVTLFSLKSLFLDLTYTWSRLKISHLWKNFVCILEGNPQRIKAVLNFNLRKTIISGSSTHRQGTWTPYLGSGTQES